MSQRLFKVGKVSVFLDGYSPHLEKRKGSGEVKVLTLTCRVQPMDAKLAQAVDDGVGGDSNVRPTLFRLNDAEAKPHLKRVNFELGCGRQNLVLYASTDTVESRMALLQAKISGVYARTQKNINGFAFIFKATFGPVDRVQQEYVHEWMLTQRAVTFEEAEPMLEMESDGDDKGESEADVKAQRPAPMWDDDAEDGTAVPPAAEDANRETGARQRIHSHQSRRKAATSTSGSRRSAKPKPAKKKPNRNARA
jgi:hypothetical protein